MSESSNSIQSNSSRSDSNHSSEKEFVIKSNENDLESSTCSTVTQSLCMMLDVREVIQANHTAFSTLPV